MSQVPGPGDEETWCQPDSSDDDLIIHYQEEIGNRKHLNKYDNNSDQIIT